MARDIDNPIHRLLWDAWASLGVSSWTPNSVGSVVDPEALIASTAAIGDERLFRESIDWGVRHATLVLPKRLTRIAEGVGLEARVGTWLATVAQASDDVSWATGRHVPVGGAFRPSGKSEAYPTSGSRALAALAVRMRGIYGASARTEIMRAFHPVLAGVVDTQSSAEIAELAASSKGNVNGTLAELARAGMVSRSGTQKRSRYRPRLHADDPVAIGVWSPLETMPWAPWHLMPQIVHLLERISVAARRPTVSKAIEAVHDYQELVLLLVRIDPALAIPAPVGSAREVVHELTRLTDEIAAQVAERVRAGVLRSAQSELDSSRSATWPSGPTTVWRTTDGMIWQAKSSRDGST